MKLRNVQDMMRLLEAAALLIYSSLDLAKTDISVSTSLIPHLQRLLIR